MMVLVVAGFLTYTNCGKENVNTPGIGIPTPSVPVEGDDGGDDVTNSPIKNETSMVTVWQTAENNESITLPLREGFEYDFQVDWGDGSEIQTITSFNDPNITHAYAQAGEYTVVMTGLAQAWHFNNDGYPWTETVEGGNKDKILKVLNFGDMGWINLFGAFHGCSNLTVFEGGVTDQVISMREMFFNASSVNPDVSAWNTSNVTNMEAMFYGATSANPDVSDWDTSNVTNMSGLFRKVAGNPDVSSWNTSNVTNMGAMFYGAASANPDVSGWDTSNVTNMAWTFSLAASANPDVSGWDTSNVTTMVSMFYLTSANPDVSNWNTENVTDMTQMFWANTSANPDVSNWNTLKVTNMMNMFMGATSANPDMSNWNFSNTESMFNMFHGATAFTTQNYSNMLNQINATTIQEDVTLGAPVTQYYEEASSARNNLISNGWTITDAGLALTGGTGSVGGIK